MIICTLYSVIDISLMEINFAFNFRIVPFLRRFPVSLSPSLFPTPRYRRFMIEELKNTLWQLELLFNSLNPNIFKQLSRSELNLINRVAFFDDRHFTIDYSKSNRLSAGANRFFFQASKISSLVSMGDLSLNGRAE